MNRMESGRAGHHCTQHSSSAGVCVKFLTSPVSRSANQISSSARYKTLLPSGDSSAYGLSNKSWTSPAAPVIHKPLSVLKTNPGGRVAVGVAEGEGLGVLEGAGVTVGGGESVGSAVIVAEGVAVANSAGVGVARLTTIVAANSGWTAGSGSRPQPTPMTANTTTNQCQGRLIARHVFMQHHLLCGLYATLTRTEHRHKAALVKQRGITQRPYYSRLFPFLAIRTRG